MASTSTTTPVNYFQEVAQMMFVFGDTSEPSDDTVALVEDLTRCQILELIVQAITQMHKRGSKALSSEDLIFLIRNDTKKVNRLKQYLSWKDVRKNVKDKSAAGPQDGIGQEDEDLVENETSKLKARKMTIKFSWELVTSFSGLVDDQATQQNEDEDSEMQATGDEDPSQEDDEIRAAYEEQVMRLRIADEITRNMTKEEYVYYSECRQASFVFKKAKKFREWSGLQAHYKNKPNSDVLDILGFLACECVSRLTETALQVKRQWDRRDKYKRLLGRTGGSGPEGRVGPFGKNSVDQSPLSPRHVQEAFRRLQSTTFAINNYKGGMVRAPLTLF